ncbi:hypothetical protein ACEWY4_006184 [Coilia grayii]|uniref:Chemokine interleukin-8-like domain-containing protein n=1 Tax=Coilia grayii TaxID=363190 RepID=A0ABD1KCX4_9TELE
MGTVPLFMHHKSRHADHTQHKSTPGVSEHLLQLSTSIKAPTKDMQLFRPIMGSLAIFTIILSFTVFESVTSEKPINCCTKVSTMKIEEQIIGFRFQKKNLPCVTAVIFQTTRGEVCSHWQEKWVQETIRAIRQKQNLERATRTAVAATTLPSVSNSTAATQYFSTPEMATSSSS